MADVIRLSFNSLRFSSSSSLLTSLNSLHPSPYPNQRLFKKIVTVNFSFSSTCDFVPRLPFIPRKDSPSFKVHATIAETDQPKWWEKTAGPNMIDIHSTQDFLNALSQAGERLVIVEFYGTWCGSCRALFPKLCRTAQEHPEIMFLKVNFNENKPMCKNLNVRVLPYSLLLWSRWTRHFPVHLPNASRRTQRSVKMSSYLWRKYADHVYSKWEKTILWDMTDYRRPKSFTSLVTIYICAFYTGVIGAAITEQLHKEEHPGEAVPIMKPKFYGGPCRIFRGDVPK